MMPAVTTFAANKETTTAHQHHNNVHHQLVDAAAESNDLGARLFLSGHFELAAEAFAFALGCLSVPSARPATEAVPHLPSLGTNRNTECGASSSATAGIPSRSAHPWPLPSTSVSAILLRFDPDAVKRKTSQASSRSCCDRESAAVLFNLALCHHALGYRSYRQYEQAAAAVQNQQQDAPATSLAARATLLAAASRHHFESALALYSRCNRHASLCGYRGEMLVNMVRAALGNSAEIHACIMGDVEMAEELLEEREAVHDMSTPVAGQAAEETLSFLEGSGANHRPALSLLPEAAPSA